MAQSKDDIKYGTAQARLNEDDALRVSYKHGTPLEAGKIADSEPVDLFSSAHKVSESKQEDPSATSKSAQSQESGTGGGGGKTDEATYEKNTWKFI
ncbi:second mef2-like protein 1 [Ranunculus cassubicifolius]